MEIAAKTAIERTGGKIFKGGERKAGGAVSKIKDTFKKRYTTELEDGTKKLNTKKTIRDSIIGFGLATAAFLGLGHKSASAAGQTPGEMPPAGH